MSNAFARMDAGVDPLVVQMEPVVQMSEDEFFRFCRQNPELRIERTAGGEIVIMPPAGGMT